MLISQEIRKKAPEMDSLRLGAGWLEEDLEKKQILIASTFGDSHPGSVHLDQLVNSVLKGISGEGGKGARYFTTDMCDGQSQGHDGINYSLASREFIAHMIEIQAMATPFDGHVFISSCDKAVPGHLKALARLDRPAIFVSGGVMEAGPNNLTLEQIGSYSAMRERGELSEEDFHYYKKNACPSCGACSFIGTASTMQILAEALGLALPGSALIPATSEYLIQMAREAGKRSLQLVDENLKPSDILTQKSFENAIMVHAAIAGSTNALLHLPAIAYELGIHLDLDLFDKIHRKIPYLLNAKPSGKYPAEYFWYAGGVPRIMEEIKDFLNLDVLTITGKTLRENLEQLLASNFYDNCDVELKARNLTREDIIKSIDHPISKEGAIAILKGNLAPDGAVIKHSAVDPAMFEVILRARVFNSEEAAYHAVINHQIQPGDAVFIRYEGPKGSGMPEMFYTTEAIATDSLLVATTALITDGRFSGATRGPAIGHVSPEASEGGPIAFVEENDLIEIDIPKRRLNIIGAGGQKLTSEEVDLLLEERKKQWIQPEPKYKKGVLGLYTKLASSASSGGFMKI
jgi:dihydroxy-acid dehydratase